MKPERSSNQLSAKELLERGVETKRTEKIPVDKLISDLGIVDKGHVRELRESMEGNRGQISPITVRARLQGREIVYDIIDGFHRGAGFKKIGKANCEAVVLYGCNDEELSDLRILAVNSVKEIKFARMAIWMQDSFEKSEWSKYGIKLSQILGLAYADSSGKILKLQTEKVEEAKTWIREKVKKWQQPLGVVYQNMRAVERSFPEIVEQVRSGKGGGKDRKGVLRQSSFIVLAETLPNNLKMQRKVVKAIIVHNLNRDEVEKMCLALTASKDDAPTLEIIYANPRDHVVTEILNSNNLLEVEEAPDEVLEEMAREEPEEDEEFPETDSEQESVEEEPDERGRNLSFADHSGSVRPGSNELSLGHVDTVSGSSKQLAAIKRLTSRTRQLQDQLDLKGNPIWFKTTPSVSEAEIKVTELLFEKGMQLEDAARLLGMTINQVIALSISAHQKYFIDRQNRELAKKFRKEKKKEKPAKKKEKKRRKNN